MSDIDLLNSIPFIISEHAYRYKQIQNRTHKKKRINKKWAKRYGHRTEKIPLIMMMGDKCVMAVEIYKEMEAVKDGIY